jgi:hypothetical protein
MIGVERATLLSFEARCAQLRLRRGGPCAARPAASSKMPTQGGIGRGKVPHSSVKHWRMSRPAYKTG